ncbi:MAG TPA: hypothetical protein VKA84_09660 [Gemmatimonadaceae bacterium]|nr:hypothetical protein [Gemmatimonadaceae bacterium]
MGLDSVIARLAAAVIALTACAPAARRAPAPASRGGMRLPVRYAADRFYVTPVSTNGDTLLLYTDTGGGANMLYEAAAARLGVAPEWVPANGDSLRLARLPAFTAPAVIPPPSDLPPFGERLMVVAPRDSGPDAGDGLLGRTWFAGRVWRFDYPGRALMLLGDAGPAGDPAHRASLGFQTDSAGRRTTHFPRIRVEVDGDSLDLLFDTGATVNLTDAAQSALGDGGPAARGTSFIARSVFDRWRERHPGWRVIEHADRTLDMPMIEVPRVSVGGYAVGPVWFTMRPDRNFHEFMSQWMDRRVEGALGGSALRYLRATVDYPRATVAFER